MAHVSGKPDTGNRTGNVIVARETFKSVMRTRDSNAELPRPGTARAPSVIYNRPGRSTGIATARSRLCFIPCVSVPWIYGRLNFQLAGAADRGLRILSIFRWEFHIPRQRSCLRKLSFTHRSMMHFFRGCARDAPAVGAASTLLGIYRS